ncbi:hypothetical protein C7H19_00490 [Aphanothece hegewaldii CCALA 016]|uniref:3-keto-disaccharide hydrolase domain-containing protein n=1 Tax=Aphanothece hegewaldii CCALA 016 TaxID=2107694 RepID=A0A2T1M3H4_9CHRO|nr:hypothetical protein [Aphanothece hegewaldii]PSF39300.1 hypothetical protein C7H19_00490 [Aphanothece hegewaldii CCALA 016]
MPTYKCRKCGNEIILSIKPGQCQICGASQFIISSPKNSKPLSGNLSQGFSNLSSGSTSKLNSSSLKSTSKQISKTNFSTGKKSNQKIDNSSLIVPPAIKHQKTYVEPTLPLYSSSSNLASSYKKLSPKPSYSQKPNLNQFFYKIILIALGVIGVLGYWLWQQQFNTNDFKKIVIKESFKSSKNWSLTDGSMVKKGSLFQQQPIPYHYGASIWKGKNFTNVDFATDVTKVKGAEDSPYGITARINGKSSENFYYLLIDSKGSFVLGKHTKDGWFPKVGWKKDSVIKSGNTKNNLRIVCKDDLIFGVINGKRVASFRDESFKSGKVAVFSMRGKGEAVTVYFDNALAKEK